MTERKFEGEPETLIRVGRVTKAHGIKGEVKVQPDFGPSEDFHNYQDILLVRKGSETEENFKVVRCRLQGRQVILKLAEISDRTEAENLRGAEVWIERLSLPDLPTGKYYWHDLIGLRVETENGRPLGSVETLMPTGGHDLLVAKDKGREYLIPLIDEFLLKIDLIGGFIVVAEVPGLFEIND